MLLCLRGVPNVRRNVSSSHTCLAAPVTGVQEHLKDAVAGTLKLKRLLSPLELQLPIGKSKNKTTSPVGVGLT